MKLAIGWLYPTLMSTYGDRGNVIVLKKRCEWRGLTVEIVKIEKDTKDSEIENCDILLGGGAQDRQQEIAVRDLKKRKKILKKMFDSGVPGLFVCGSPQLLGEWYMTGDGTKLEGLGIFDFVTKHFGDDKSRLIGNTVGEISQIKQFNNETILQRKTIVGFENHGGRTYLGKSCESFAKVIKGNGNNGEDGTEGAVYKNVIACYYHGPLLSKNPHIADWLLTKALETKYKKSVELESLDDTLEWSAHKKALEK
jgi:CobQ-like glutamine amidotransferase family enzyme